MDLFAFVVFGIIVVGCAYWLDFVSCGFGFGCFGG